MLIFGFLFVDQKVKIRTVPSLMHDKVIIVDGATVITGKKSQYSVLLLVVAWGLSS